LKRKVTQIVLLAAMAALIGVLFLLRSDKSDVAGKPGPAENGTVGNGDNAEKLPLAIISPHWIGIKKEFGAAFDKWHEAKYGRGVKIEWRELDAGSGSILRFVEDQFGKSPQGIGIDAIFGGGGDLYLRLGDKLQPTEIEPAILSGLRAELSGTRLYDEKMRWFGVALSGFGFIYHKGLLAKHRLPKPTSWEDLASAKAFKLTSSADPRRSGSNHACYEVILQAYGWEKGYSIASRLIANLKSLSDGSSGAIAEVANGNCAYGLAIDFYAWSKIREIGADKLGYITPEAVSVINPDPIGVFRGAPNGTTAKRFVNFVLSEEGQKLWMLPVGSAGGPIEHALDRMAVRFDLYDKLGDNRTVPVNPFKVKTSFKYDSRKAATRYQALNQLLGATLLNPRKELREAWQAVIGRGLKPREVKLLCEPPVSEKELMALSVSFEDALFKQKKLAEWERWARRKYETLKNAR